MKIRYSLILLLAISFLAYHCTPLTKMNVDSKNRLSTLIRLSSGNHDLGFRKYVEECRQTGKAIYIPASFHLQLCKAPIRIHHALQMKGGGKISGTGQNDMFRLEDNANIQISNITFQNFACVLKAGKRDIEYQLDIDSVRLENCESLIFAGMNDQEVKPVGPIRIKNSVFKNCIGPVIEIRNLHLTDVEVANNQFFNDKKLRNKSTVIELGGGVNRARGKNIRVTNNKIDNFNFFDKACAIFVHGATEVLISDNELRNICSTHPTDKDSHGIYIKASQAKILRNVLVDAGEGEGAILNKGHAKNHAYTSPGTPPGDNVLVADNKISYTNAYHQKAKKNITGILVMGTNQTVRNNIIENTTNAIELRSGPIIKDVAYTGGFKIIGNKIRSLQLCKKPRTVTAVRGIGILQDVRNVEIRDNEISIKGGLACTPTFAFGITCLTRSNTENIMIVGNTITNELNPKNMKSSSAINFRTKAAVETVNIQDNIITGFTYGTVFNDNDSRASYRDVKVKNKYKNIQNKKEVKIFSKKEKHSIRFEKN